MTNAELPEVEIPEQEEKKQRKTRTPDDYVVQVLDENSGSWSDIKSDFKDTEDGKKFVRVAIPAEFEQFVGERLRVIAVKWEGTVDVEKVVKGTLSD